MCLKNNKKIEQENILWKYNSKISSIQNFKQTVSKFQRLFFSNSELKVS